MCMYLHHQAMCRPTNYMHSTSNFKTVKCNKHQLTSSSLAMLYTVTYKPILSYQWAQSEDQDITTSTNLREGHGHSWGSSLSGNPQTCTSADDHMPWTHVRTIWWHLVTYKATVHTGIIWVYDGSCETCPEFLSLTESNHNQKLCRLPRTQDIV